MATEQNKTLKHCIMPRRKSPEQIEFANTVEYKPNAKGVMRPVRLAPRDIEKPQPRPKRDLHGIVSIRIEEASFEYIESHRGDFNRSQFINQLLSEAIKRRKKS